MTDEYVPAIDRPRCPACDQSFRGWSMGKRWSHYLEHTYGDPIPARFLVDRRYNVDPAKRRTVRRQEESDGDDDQ